MLNASRHHRKNRGNTARTRHNLPRAQRLAASQEKSHGGTSGTTSCSSGAQRLAASQEKSPHAKQRRLSFSMSAQRLAASQEKSQSLFGRHQLRTQQVLNASRHHRKNRTRGESCSATMTCSTPRGITGKIASAGLFDKIGMSSAQRLAASQEKSHAQIIFRFHLRVQARCSTPRGITGKIADGHMGRSAVDDRCSTPRGITGKIALLAPA